MHFEVARHLHKRTKVCCPISSSPLKIPMTLLLLWSIINLNQSHCLKHIQVETRFNHILIWTVIILACSLSVLVDWTFFCANVPNVSTIYVISKEEECKVPPPKELKRIMMSHEHQDVWVLFNSCEKKCWKARLEKFIVWNAWFLHLSKARMWNWGQRPTLLNCSNSIKKPKLEGL
jgi:hypothetical protein